MLGQEEKKMSIVTKNKYIIIAYVFAMVFLLFKATSIDQQFSQSIWRVEGSRTSNFSEDASVLGEITSDAKLRQEIQLPPGVLQIGVRFGTFMRNNDSKYQIVLYDNEGNIVAKRVISAERIEDNGMCYITLYGKTSGKVTYILEISSTDAARGNAVTGYGVPKRDGYNSCTLGGQDTGKEIVVELIMQKVFPITICLAVLLTVFLVVFLFWNKLKYVLGQLVSFISGIWKKEKRKIIGINVILSVLGIVLVFVYKKEEFHLLPDSAMSGQYIICPYSEKMTRNFQVAQDFEAIEIRLATYLQKYKQGKLHFALYETNSGNLLLKEEVAADQIKDNRLLKFDFKKICLDKTTDFYFEIWTEDFEEQALGVYCDEENGKVQYQLSRKEKVVSFENLIIFLMWGMLWLLVWVGISIKEQKKMYYIVISIISLFLGLLFSTYANYGSLSLKAFAKNIGLSVDGDLQEYDRSKVKDCTSRVYRYDARGNVYAIYDQIVMEEVRTRADTVEIYLERTDYKKKNNVAVFVDYGDGFGKNADVEYEYIYRGQEKITIPVKNLNIAERVMLSFNMINEGGFSEEYLDSGYRYYGISKIILNNEKVLWYKAWGAMLIGIVLVWLIFIWKKYSIENIAGRWMQSGRSREAKVFFVIALLFGIVFSILLPTFQAPDEPVHMRWAFESIGANEIYKQVVDIAGQGVEDVIQNGVVTVNIDTYWKGFNEALNSYDFSFKLNSNVLNYPGQVCGILLGVLFHLPASWILFFAEFGALLVYALFGAIAIRIVPCKKELFAMVLLMPMAIQQAGSFSYDSFNNIIAALTIAYILYLALDKEKIGIKELAVAAGMLVILLMIKKVYVVCGLLVLLIPIEKYEFYIFKRKIEFKSMKAKISLLGILLGGGCLCVCTGIYILAKTGMVTTVFEIISFPKEFGRLIFDTVNAQGNAWIKQGSGLFGWLDGIMHDCIIWVLIVGLLTAAIVKAESTEKWNGKKYLICVITFMASMGGIILSMVGWSSMIYGTTGSLLNQMLLFPSIEGVQGRYFLPVLFLPFLFPIAKWMQNLRRHMPVYLILLLVTGTSIGYSIFMLLQRYWVV